MNGKAIDDHMREQGSWVDWDQTTDTFKAGDPLREVKTVAVAWKASWDALREAVSKGADLFVSHESISVNAVNGSREPDAAFALPSEKPKFDWLEETGLVVYRCHDVWDRFPEVGIRDSWQKGLEIGPRIAADAFPLYVTERSPISLGDLARHVLQRVRPLGQNAVMVTGSPDVEVDRVATGTGVTTTPVRMKELGANVGIVTDDYYLHVRMGVHAGELDFPTIVANHGVSEEWGVANLARYLQRVFPELNVFHIPQSCPYTAIID